MSSIAFNCLKTTFDAIQEMARMGAFCGHGSDTLRGVSPDAVVLRVPRQAASANDGDRGENNLNLPGIVVSHIRHQRPVTGGENIMDDGVVQQIIQIVDRVDDQDASNIESYLRWQEDIREFVQTNPYRGATHPQGNAYHVHVSDQVAPDNRRFLLREAKLVLQINIYTRTRVDREQVYHDN